MPLSTCDSSLKIFTDARIHELFFNGETGLACEPTLPRDYYVTALGAPDPLAAIRTAHERAADPHYQRAQFRRDVQAWRQASQQASPPPAPASMALTGRPVSVDISRLKLSGAARFALRQLIQATGHSIDLLISDALVRRYHTLTEAQAMDPIKTANVAGSFPSTAKTTRPADSARRGRRFADPNDGAHSHQQTKLF